jgi:hypothetical protein
VEWKRNKAIAAKVPSTDLNSVIDQRSHQRRPDNESHGDDAGCTRLTATEAAQSESLEPASLVKRAMSLLQPKGNILTAARSAHHEQAVRLDHSDPASRYVSQKKRDPRPGDCSY